MSVASGLSIDNVIIVGEKNFGESNGTVYIRRNKPDYFEQYIEVADKERYIVRNQYFAKKYGRRYLDLMRYVTNDEGKVRVFSPDHHYISADNLHFSVGGARYFAEKIDWRRYYK